MPGNKQPSMPQILRDSSRLSALERLPPAPRLRMSPVSKLIDTQWASERRPGTGTTARSGRNSSWPLRAPGRTEAPHPQSARPARRGRPRCPSAQPHDPCRQAQLRPPLNGAGHGSWAILHQVCAPTPYVIRMSGSSPNHSHDAHAGSRNRTRTACSLGRTAPAAFDRSHARCGRG